MTRSRALVAVAGAAVAAALVAGCAQGAGTDALPAAASAAASPTSPADALGSALDKAADSRSVSARVTATVAGDTVTATGAVQRGDAPGQGKADVTVTAAGRPPAHLLLVDGHLYVQQPDLALLLGKPWGVVDVAALARQARDRAGATADPTAAYEALERALLAATDVVDAGTETVDGVEATHYRGTLRPAQLLAGLADLPAALRDRLSAALSRSAVATVQVDAWVGPDGRPVKLSASASTSFGPCQVVVDSIAYDHPVTVTAPPAGQTADLQGLASAAGVGGLRGLLGPGGLSGLLGGASG